MRLFFAIPLPSEAAQAVTEHQSVLQTGGAGRGFRWSGPGALHITLRFVGEIPENRLEDIRAAGRAAARACEPFDAALGAPAWFGTARAARVLWVGLKVGTEPCVRLAAALDGALAEAGIAPEARPFTAHVTLARSRSRTGEPVPTQIENCANIADKYGVFHVGDFVLFSSEPAAGGHRYSVIESFSLTDTHRA